MKKDNLSEELHFGVTRSTCKACQSCKHAFGLPPFEDSPDKSNCEMFPFDEGENKPASVMYDGGECAYYEKR